jgi:hypothetical protein
MAGPCRFDAHVALCSSISGYATSIPVCEELAAYTAIVRIEPVDGVGLTVDSEVCDKHNRKLAGAAHYQRSIKLRQST